MIAALAAVALLVPTPQVGKSAPQASHATSPSIQGVLKTSGNREPIAHARVLAVPARAQTALGPVPESGHLDPSADPPPWMRSTTTDDDGRFSFEELQAPRVRIIIVAAGYRRHEVILDATQLRRRGAVLFATPDDGAAMRTVVETRREPPSEQVNSTTMDAEEIRTAPGTQGDPLRALQNLPGVARTPGGFGLLVLRGASPAQSRVFLGGHALPRAFHSLAIASVVPAATIDRMEFVPSNFGARYGDATGGLVVLHPAQLERRRIHGEGRIDLLGAGALASGPLRKGAWLIAAQRGWADAVLTAAERVDSEQAFTLPRYYNYQTFFEHPVGHDAVIVARVLGAGDRFQARSPHRNSRPRLAFEMVSQFHRADLSYRVTRGPWAFWLTPSVRMERNGWRQPAARARSIRDDTVLSLRAEATRALTRHASLTVGADTEVDRYSTTAKRPFNQLTGDPDTSTTLRGMSTAVGVYTQSSVGIGDWTLAPGLRASAFSLGPATRSALDPRLNVHWRFASRWRWSAGAGVYSQARIQQTSVSGGFLPGTAGQIAGNVVLPASLLSLEPRAGFSPARGGLSVARAAQTSTAISRELGESWFLQLAAWARMRDNADGFRQEADGTVDVVTSTWSTAYGLEALVRRRIGPKLWGWMGYTLSRVEERVLDRVGPPRGPNVSPSAFDQRHNLVLLASYRLPHRWRIGGRFRLVSGSPFTDVAGVVWVPPSSTPIAAAGPPNRGRFPLFHQLDLRVDKSWLLQRMELGAYIDVQNVYNQLNPEAFIYSADYTRRVDAVGLPIFPSLGFRIDY
ncbi:MAG: TonB-dependent receptor [Nannocystaceae bacterium]|nr:TonB-dependent receptor [Nannocystaceae bacterium]